MALFSLALKRKVKRDKTNRKIGSDRGSFSRPHIVVLQRTLAKTGALKISDITWRMASLAEAPPHTKMRVSFAGMRESKLVGRLATFALAASDVDDEMTNNSRRSSSHSWQWEGKEGGEGEWTLQSSTKRLALSFRHHRGA